METFRLIELAIQVLKLSHSLGKLIEWKHYCMQDRVNFAHILSHSLGKLIEWKRFNALKHSFYFLLSHSLGKLIEWKHF